jgi:hypothetical protein
MRRDRPRARSVLVPLLMVWLAVHAVLLLLILSLKFLGVKTLALLLLLTAAFWFLTGRRRPSLPRLSGMV